MNSIFSPFNINCIPNNAIIKYSLGCLIVIRIIISWLWYDDSWVILMRVVIHKSFGSLEWFCLEVNGHRFAVSFLFTSWQRQALWSFLALLQQSGQERLHNRSVADVLSVYFIIHMLPTENDGKLSFVTNTCSLINHVYKVYFLPCFSQQCTRCLQIVNISKLQLNPIKPTVLYLIH